ncbi:MAG TPA: GreA/GreB family elongation factor [Solirubrobacter sp.]
MSRADLSAAVHELDSLRGAHRLELAARLRDARAYGTASNDDDHLAVLEDAAVERIKIAQLERLIASATVVDDDAADADVAGLGSVVRVRDQRGRETDYELVGRLAVDGTRAQVTPGSPVGEALMRARVGDVVAVLLPNGRARTLTVVAVHRMDA